MKLLILLPIILVLQTSSCSFVFEVGMEKTPTSEGIPPAIALNTAIPTSTTTISPTEAPTKTLTPTLPEEVTATTAAEQPTRTPTQSPSPTALPGKVVVPITSLGSDIPWLPIDKTRWPAVYVVTFNILKPPFDNPRVRQAFAASIDKDVIVKMAEKWYAIDPSPATTFIPPQTLGRDLYGEVGINFDPVRARSLLTQAGYTDTASFPKVTFIVNSYGDTAPGARFNMASAMAEMWHTYLGVTVEVQALKPPTFGERIRSDPPELFWVGWLPDPGNDPDFIRSIFHTDAGLNHGHFSDPAFDTLVDQASALHDPTARQALYIEAERLLCETDAGIIPLYHTFQNIP